MYSQEFINKVKECYSSSPEMHKMAKEGEYFLGRYLDDSSQGGISVDTILLATSLDELQKTARELKKKKELYAMWHKETKIEINNNYGKT